MNLLCRIINCFRRSKTSDLTRELNAIIPFLLLFTLSSFQNHYESGNFFESVSPKKSGVQFKNTLIEDKKNNILTYEYFYNGGGVAVGDLDNDGLDDIFFTGNMTGNRLYHNQGGFQFKDITASAGLSGKDSWTTGACMVDINGDGLLDIYVCYSGNGSEESRRNELYINQGGLKFTEEAAKYGLDDPSHSTQALFFDFDRDGDLDMYLLNHNIKVIHELEFDEARRHRHPLAGDKLYRNDNGRFTDISEQAGILGNAMGFGLGVMASDINGDGWLDLYVSNDYIEPDYLYINNGDGTFSEQLTTQLQHISHFSMGLDIADINNNGLMDIFTLDMLPEDNKRQKLLYGPENYEQYALMVMKGFYHQNMRNMLQLNHGNGTFSEIGQLANISQTDWSWASLFFDVDNDGHKDLFVTNGYYRDYTNRDFLKYKGDYYFQKAISKERADTLFLVTSMTSTPLPNYAFRNNGNTTFSNQSANWGLDQPGFSNGAAFADLDNDGQLDLIVNNLNDVASLYRNRKKEKKKHHYIQIILRGKGANTSAIGASVTVYTGDQLQRLEQMPTRGFQSSVSHRLHFGLGDYPMVDSILVKWPTGEKHLIKNIPANQILELDERKPLENEHQKWTEKQKIPLYQSVPSPVNYLHREAGFNDFKRQPLLMDMPSYIGPVMAATYQIQPDKLTLFVGGTKDNPGKLYQENDQGKLIERKDIHLAPEHTDADALFFDANQDGYPDLYLASGGYHDYAPKDKALQDRLYLYHPEKGFEHHTGALPEMPVSSSIVRSADINGDGFPDLFVGGRITPGQYPIIPESHILINDGSGQFSNGTDLFLPPSIDLGMVTDAVFIDLNQDGWEDLVVVGECMPVKILINREGKTLEDQTALWLPDAPHGLWTKIGTGDFDQDGDMDFILGNYGLNTPFRANKEQPMTLYYGDFDGNGSIDPIMVCHIQGKPYPFASRDELLDQMYGLRSKFTDYASYSTAKIEQVLSKSQLKKASTLQVNELQTVYLENKGNGFVIRPLPVEAQFAPVYSIQVMDFNDDGHLDFILGGNQTYTRLRIGVIDANYGQVFLGNGKGDFSYLPQNASGFAIKGDVKSIIPVQLAGQSYLLFGLNNQGVVAYQKQNNQ